jgi:cytoskeletal protein RodZ
MTARHQIRVGGRRLGRDRSPIDATRAPSVGELLYAAREKKGVDLYRAERDTKIRARHLSALEDGDYAQLPGSVYAKGFLRNYALYLGLDPEELLSKWRDEQEPGDRSETVTMVRPPQPLAEPGRRLTFTPGLIVAGVLSVVVLLFAAYVGMQLLRFSQAALLTVEGPAIVQLGAADSSTIFRGTSAPHSVINVADGAGSIVKSVTAGDDGRWEIALAVSMGENDFSITARDPVTSKDSDPRSVRVMVPLPATPTPLPTRPLAAAASAAIDPGTTATPGGSTPVATSTGSAASLTLAAPRDGARVSGATVSVRGSTDARAVRVSAAWTGSAGSAPTPPDPVTLDVSGGAFSGGIDVAPGAWTIQVRALAANGGTDTILSSNVNVAYTGLVVTIAAQGGSAWMQVAVDGQLADPGHTYHRGESQTFEAKHSVVIHTGNESTTAVTVNGEPKGTLGTKATVGTWAIDKGKEPRALP